MNLKKEKDNSFHSGFIVGGLLFGSVLTIILLMIKFSPDFEPLIFLDLMIVIYIIFVFIGVAKLIEYYKNKRQNK